MASTTTADVHPGVPVMAPQFQDPNFILDPYPLLEQIRETGPVVFDENTGQYLISDYADCTTVLNDAASFASDKEFFVDLFGGETMECMERERHLPVRGVWAKDFRRPTLKDQRQMIADVVEGEIAGFADRLRAGETVDAVADMIRAIPTLVIAKMMDIPDADIRQFAAWSDAMAGIGEGRHDPTPNGAELVRNGKQATADLNAYIAERIELLRRNGTGDDLVSRMVEAPAAKDMTAQEIVASNTQLVFAGNETTAKLFSAVMRALAEHPDQLAALREDRSLIPAALEEIHRWQSVVHLGWRFVQGRQRVGGTDFDDGDVVVCLQGGANRDPKRWDDPNTLDIARPYKAHLGFGHGMHMCIGVHLARIEAEIWLNRLLDEVPAWDVHDVEWGTDWVLRGPTRLTVAAAS